MSRIKELRQKKANLTNELTAIIDNPEGEDGLLSEDQEKDYQAKEAQLEKISKQLDMAVAQRDRELELEAGLNQSQQAENNSRPHIEVGEDPNMEFRSFGDFLCSVANAADHTKDADPRLLYQHKKQAAASGLNMSTPSEGGFLLQTQFSTALLESAMNESMLMTRCRNIPIGEGFDGLEAPYIDEKSRANGSRLGGVQVYRNHEAESVTAKKPKFGKLDLRLEEITGIAYITNRLLRNFPALESIVTMGFAEEFGFKIDDEIVRGSGAGECLGYLNSDATVSIPKESGQAADTVVTDNILKMRAAMPAKNRRNGIWLVNSELEPQIQKLTIDVGTGGVPVWVPANGLADEPFDRILGRPLIPIEQASAPGDVGDISFVDLMRFILITQGALQTATSMHVKFLTDEMTFRFKYLVNGQPMPSSAKTPYKGTQAKSPFITLAAR